MSNGKGKIKQEKINKEKDECSKEHKEWCASKGKVAYYDKEKNKCGCKPAGAVRSIKSRRAILINK